MSEEQKGVKERFRNFCTMSRRENISLFVVFLGVVVTLFQAIIGGIVVGFVAGLFLADEIKCFSRQFKEFFQGEKRFKMLLFTGIFLCIFLSLPSLFFGALAGVGVNNLTG